MKKTIEERYEYHFLEAALYWIRWVFVWAIAVLVLLYSLKSEDLEPNTKLLFMLVGSGFLLYGVQLSSGVHWLKGIWFNFFVDVGLVKKKKLNFHELSDALANVPMVFALIYFLAALLTLGRTNLVAFLYLSMVFFVAPYGFTIALIVMKPFLEMDRKRRRKLHSNKYRR